MVLMAALSVTVPSARSGEGPEAQQATPRNFEVRLKNSKIDQKEITISVGDTVTWINEDGIKHSVTPDAGSALKPPEIVLEGGAISNRIKFDKEGDLNYHCKFHSTMIGKVTVKK
jgi:plastocyanin